MVKRLTWFVSGAVAGAAGAGYAKRKVQRTASALAPVNVAKDVGRKVRTAASSVGDAVRDGRDAMRAKEAELRARLEGRALSLDAAVTDRDTVMVDGEPIEPDRVVVLRDATELRPGQRRKSRSSRRLR